MNANKMMKSLILVGEIMVESGAEITRVEETIIHIADAYSLDNVDVAINPKSIFISFYLYDQNYLKMKSLKNKGFDLNRINNVNALSRSLKDETMDIDDFYKQLLKYSTEEYYSDKTKCIASGFVAMFFCLFFNGSFIDSLFAFGIGILIQVLMIYLNNSQVYTMIKYIILTFTFTFLALLFTQLGFTSSKDSIITADLMLLVPGLAITNAIRDSIAGDTLSGIIRGYEALLISISLVVGTVGTLVIWEKLISGVL